MLQNNFCSVPISGNIPVLLQQTDKSIDLIQRDHTANLFVRQIRIGNNELGRITAIDPCDHFVQRDVGKAGHPILPGKERMRSGWKHLLNLRGGTGIG